MSFQIRQAHFTDDSALADLDRRCWAIEHEVVPKPAAGQPFFGSSRRPEDVLVADCENELAGWLILKPPTPLASNTHVQQISGLGVEKRFRRRGIGRALIDAAIELGRLRGATWIRLRVLGTNTPARRLYLTSGFTVEGVLAGEFRLGGNDVDDVLMGRPL